MKNRLLIALVDLLHGYTTRLSCPHCPLTIRYRCVSESEAAWWRDLMVRHRDTHRAQ